MIVSTRKTFIFCAMNKTGTTSVEHALRPYRNRFMEWRLRRAYRRLGRTIPAKHMVASDFRLLVGEQRWNDYFTFCFVRNPFDRLVSVYKYHRDRIADKHPMAKELDFETWIMRGGSGSAVRLMADFVSDEQGTPIVDFIGRYETLQADFHKVCQQIGIESELPWLNSTEHDHYAQYYTPAAHDEVARRFRRDLEIFGYTFVGPTSSRPREPTGAAAPA